MVDHSITALILAGGLSKRMNGVAKGLVCLHHKTLLTHALDLLEQQVPKSQILISANCHQEDYAPYGYPVIADLRDNFCGPLAGIESALRVVDSEYLAVVPCDMPCLPSHLLKKLKKPFYQNNLYASYAVLKLERSEKPYPLCLLLKTSTLSLLEGYLKEGYRRALDWLKLINAQPVLFNHADYFVHINTPSELAYYENKYPVQLLLNQ